MLDLLVPCPGLIDFFITECTDFFSGFLFEYDKEFAGIGLKMLFFLLPELRKSFPLVNYL